MFVDLQGCKETPDGLLLSIEVKPSCRDFSIVISDSIKVNTRSPAHNNKANREVLKEFKRLLKRPVYMIAGGTSNDKVLLIKDCTIVEFRNLVSSG